MQPLGNLNSRTPNQFLKLDFRIPIPTNIDPPGSRTNFVLSHCARPAKTTTTKERIKIRTRKRRNQPRIPTTLSPSLSRPTASPPTERRSALCSQFSFRSLYLFTKLCRLQFSFSPSQTPQNHNHLQWYVRSTCRDSRCYFPTVTRRRETFVACRVTDLVNNLVTNMPPPPRPAFPRPLPSPLVVHHGHKDKSHDRLHMAMCRCPPQLFHFNRVPPLIVQHVCGLDGMAAVTQLQCANCVHVRCPDCLVEAMPVSD